MNSTNQYHNHVLGWQIKSKLSKSKRNPSHSYLNELIEIYFK